jgi:hypothetical protein
MNKWIAITAGIGSTAFEEAAFRVRNDLEKSGVVDKVVAITTANLKEVCPKTSALYVDLMNTETPKYGYLSWKAEIVDAAFAGYWGDFDGVIWIDAGCEITINLISKIRFQKFIAYAQSNGVSCFTLDTLEIEYTKRDLFEFFPEIDPQSAGKQIQTTWFFLYGEAGKKISREWLATVLADTNFLDFSPSKLPEYEQFIQNRSDQSTFSLVCKMNSAKPLPYIPTSGHGSFLSQVNGFFHPIWTSRNRKGPSMKRRMHKLVELSPTRKKSTV